MWPCEYCLSSADEVYYKNSQFSQVYCGECAGNRSISKSKKATSKTRPFSKCQVAGCNKPVSSPTAMYHLYLWFTLGIDFAGTRLHSGVMALFFPHSVDTQDALNRQAFFLTIYIQSNYDLFRAFLTYTWRYLGSLVAHQSIILRRVLWNTLLN